MLYLCIARPRISCSCRASPVFFCPFQPKNRPGEGATKCFVIFSAGFVVFSAGRIIFFRSFVVSRKQPADCFRRLKTLKLRPLGSPFFRAAHAVRRVLKSPKGGPPCPTSLFRTTSHLHRIVTILSYPSHTAGLPLRRLSMGHEAPVSNYKSFPYGMDVFGNGHIPVCVGHVRPVRRREQ